MQIDIPKLIRRSKAMTDRKTAVGHLPFRFIVDEANKELAEDKSMNRKGRKRVLHRVLRALKLKKRNYQRGMKNG